MAIYLYGSVDHGLYSVNVWQGTKKFTIHNKHIQNRPQKA